MNIDKLREWMDLAQQVESGEFWENIFDNKKNEKPEPAHTLAFEPAVDIIRRDAELLVIADLPGFQKNEIQISISGTELILRGTRKQEEALYLLSERRKGSFERSVPLPPAVVTEAAAASLELGLLVIRFPYREQSESFIPLF